MNILFVCKHNVFRSRVAEILFNKLNKNKKFNATSAGLIRWDKKDLKNAKGFIAEQIEAKKSGINLKVNSKELHSSLLKKTDILVIVADDVQKSIFETEKSFKGKIIVWKIPDVKETDKDKAKVAEKTIRFIESKIKNFINNL